GWMSKAGPSGAEIAVQENVVRLANEAFPTADAGLYETEGTLWITLPMDGPECALYRRNHAIKLKPGESFMLRRLDFLVTGVNQGQPIRVEHRTLGRLTFPTGAVITAYNASEVLTAESKKKVEEWVGAALDGDGDAVH